MLTIVLTACRYYYMHRALAKYRAALLHDKILCIRHEMMMTECHWGVALAYFPASSFLASSI